MLSQGLGVAISLLTMSAVAGEARSQSSCLATAAVDDLGGGSAGSMGVPLLSIDHAPAIGTTMIRLELEQGAPSGSGLLVISDAADPIFLESHGATLFPKQPWHLLAFETDAEGQALIDFSALGSIDKSLCGLALIAQAVIHDGDALAKPALSNALSITFGLSGLSPAPVVFPVPTPTSSATTIVRGTGTVPNNVIRVEGGAAVVETLVGPTGRFAVVVPLSLNAVNQLFVSEIGGNGSSSSFTGLQIAQDSTPPELVVDSPTDGQVISQGTASVTGRVSDLLSGLEGLTVSVNGVPADVVTGIGIQGTFHVIGIPLESGTPTTLTATATDAVGNSIQCNLTVVQVGASGGILEVIGGAHQTGVVKHLLAEPVRIVAKGVDGNPLVAQPVRFEVVKSDGSVALPGGGTFTRGITVVTDLSGGAAVDWMLGSDAGAGNNRLSVQLPATGAELIVCASAMAGTATRLGIDSGNLQSAPVDSTLPLPLRVVASDGANGVAAAVVRFAVITGDAALSPASGFPSAGQIELFTDSGGHAEAILSLGSDPGPVRVVASLTDPGAPVVAFSATAILADRVSTSLAGVVFDNSGQPLGGATCRLELADGSTFLTASAGTGMFTFESGEHAGDAHLIIDGATVTTVAGLPIDAAIRFPSLPVRLLLTQNAANVVPSPIRLPRISKSSEVSFDGTADVELMLPGIEASLIRVGKDTEVHHPDGTRVDAEHPILLSVTQVHADDVPMPLPDGVAPPFAGTMQPSGTTFSPALRVVMPNLGGLAPGQVSYVRLFDHDTGKFEIVASATVSDDSTIVVTDAGQGISVAGWYECDLGPPPTVPDLTGDPNCANLPAAQQFAASAQAKLDAATALLSGVQLTIGNWSAVQATLHLAAVPAILAQAPLFCSACIATIETPPINFVTCCSCIESLIGLPTSIQAPLESLEPLVTDFAAAPSALAAARAQLEGAADDMALLWFEDDCAPVSELLQAKQAAFSETIATLLALEDEYASSLVLPLAAALLPTLEGLSSALEALDTGLNIAGACPPTDQPVGSPADGNTLDELLGMVIASAESAATALAKLDPLVGDLKTRTTLASAELYSTIQLAMNTSCYYFAANQVTSPDVFGNFTLPNVPDGAGAIRVDAVCVTKEQLLFGRSGYVVPQSGPNPVGEFEFSTEPFPDTVSIAVDLLGDPLLTTFQSTEQFIVTAELSDGTTRAVEGLADGATVTSSNPEAVAAVFTGLGVGIVQAQGYGSSAITVTKDGAISSFIVTAIPEDLLHELTRIAGIVVTPDGMAVSGADVSTSAGFRVASGPDGAFVIDCHPFTATDISISAVVGGTQVSGFLQNVGLNTGGVGPLLCNGFSPLGNIVVDVDSDKDGLPDWYESSLYGTSSTAADTDGDGLSDGDEVLDFGTDAALADSDADGIQDGVELDLGLDPNLHNATTTIVGEVATDQGDPAAGAVIGVEMSSSSRYGSTANAVGQFQIDAWPASLSPLVVTATAADGMQQGMSAPAAAVAGGFTDVGLIEMHSTLLGSLFPGQIFAAGAVPLAVAAGDVNRDGVVDCVAANFSSGNVSVLIGTGTGSFDAPLNSPVGLNPRSIALGDLDQDGDLDLAVANSGSASVSILLGQGDGLFAPALNFPVPAGPRSIVIGNFDGDSRPDLAVASSVSNSVSVLFGLGLGFFAGPVNYAVGTDPQSLGVGDLNGDGLLDLAVASQASASVTVLLGQPGGAFSSLPSMPAGSSPAGLALGDLNGDGLSDLAVSDPSSLVFLFFGNGDGSFAPAVGIAAGTLPGGVVIDDLDSDGIVDLAVTNEVLHGLTVLRGLGAGTFAAPVTFPAGINPALLTTGDFDGDRMGDIAVASNSSAGGICILLGHSYDGFSQGPFLASGGTSSHVAMGVLTEGNVLDLAVTSSADTVEIFAGNGDGTFAPPQAYVTATGSGQVAIGDLDSNDQNDFVVVSFGGAAAVHLADGAGGFAAPAFYPAGLFPKSVSIADFNSDKHFDLAIGNEGGGTVSVLLGAGDGTFAPGTEYLAGGSPLIALGSEDLDRDGAPDIVAANGFTNRVYILLGNGDGTFATATNYLTGSNPRSIAIGDLNRDGFPDLALATLGSGGVSLLMGVGDGTFSPFQALSVANGMQSIGLGDLNADGLADLAVSSPGSVSLLPGNGDGTFAAPLRFGAGPNPIASSIGDLNGDGKLDLAFATVHPGVLVLLHR